MPRLVRPFAPLVAGAALALAALPARAHVVPSVDSNNRYVKLSPMGDRVRLAYTVLYGDRPGAAMRRRLDRDRDGQISAQEADALGSQLGASLAPALTIAVDGQPVVWTWARIDVGLGTPSTTGGSLSVDLIAWICTPAGAAHRVELRDEYVVETAGDSELKLEEGPGVHLGARTLGGETMASDDATWTGQGGPITTGLDLRYTVDADATRPNDGRCHTDATRSAVRTRWPIVAGAALALIVIVALQARSRRRRDQKRKG